jgi:catechol 2,3-dioxygenase-like lactoylglutathione lyase family enzyme
MWVIKLSNRTICVKDIEASEKFYCDALGFEPVLNHAASEHQDLAAACALPSVKLHAKILKRPDGPSVQLIQFIEPLAEGPRERRSTLEFGLVHISFYVDDIDIWADRITAQGGTVYEHTRAYFEGNDTTLIYCTDPDGTRVELMISPGEAERFSHGGICVDDIEASMRFYEALGFGEAENYVLDAGFDWLGVVNEVPGIKLRAQMMRNADGDTIELLKVFEPQCFGSRERQPINRFGLRYLEFNVDDAGSAVANLVAAGGKLDEVDDAVFGDRIVKDVIDHNGVRVKLKQLLAA